MKKTLFLLLIMLTTILSGCFEIHEKIILNKNNSGEYELIFDFSQIFKDPSMRSVLEESEEPLSDSDETVQLIDLYEGDKGELKNKEFWKKVKKRIYINEQDELFTTTYSFDFKNINEILIFYSEIEMFEKDNWFTCKNNQFNSSKKSITRITPFPIDGMTKGEESDESEMNLMETFLEGLKLTTTYVLPGKVKSSSIPNSSINGNSVTVESKYAEMKIDKKLTTGTIKFKNK